jgi:hypothetical protein
MAQLLVLLAAPSDEEILAAVEVWIDDLAAGDYQTAFERTAHDPYYAWSADLIRAVVAGYGLPEAHPSGEVFAVSRRTDTPGQPFHRIVDRTAATQDEVAEVWYDLPLNGAWSDLTATFSVQQRIGHAVLVLQQIHVF